MEISDRLIISKPIYIEEPYKKCGYCKGSKPESNNFALQSWYDLHKSTQESNGISTSSSSSSSSSKVEIDNCTMGIHVELVSVAQYDELCNLGFRRSGKYLYKPDLLRNCCRLYTIRTTLQQCKLSKELKTCVKRFKKFTNAQDCQIPTSSSSNNNKNKIISKNNNNNNEKFDFIKELYNAEKFSANGDFYTKFEPSIFSQEKYNLFVKYQQAVHNDIEGDEESFKNFLCHTPFAEDVVMGNEEEWDELNSWKEIYANSLITVEEEEEELTKKKKRQSSNSNKKKKKTRYGPVHECYYFKGKLIALAVLDFLPTGISSVYFIWDPDYSKWNLGKISALKEMAMVSILKRDYYYLGYYIDDCPKMVYKKKFGGDLLDVCNNQYVPLNKVEKYIENGKFFALANEKNQILNKKRTSSPLFSDEDEDVDEDDETEHCELPLNNKIKYDINKPLVNIAEKIYGQKEGHAIQHANESIIALAKYGIEYTSMFSNDFFKAKPIVLSSQDDKNKDIEDDDDDDDEDIPGYTKEIYSIPTIVPGLVPLWQLLQIIESGEINSINNKLLVYNTRTNQVRKIENFLKENKSVKRCICNVIRLIGLKATAKSLIII